MKAVARGNITLSLRIVRDEDGGTLALNEATMGAVLDALSKLESEALSRGLTLAPARSSELLALRGMLDASAAQDDSAPLVAQIKDEFGALLDALVQMRRDEGQQLQQVLEDQINRIETLRAQAATLAEARKEATAMTLRTNLERVMDNSAGADPDRVAQELALIAVKADVTEEIDRLAAHVAAARELLVTGGSVGRKLDFLMQEFNREANTLCSKSQSSDLTAVGLELKAVIDQMREQVQNVE